MAVSRAHTHNLFVFLSRSLTHMHTPRSISFHSNHFLHTHIHTHSIKAYTSAKVKKEKKELSICNSINISISLVTIKKILSSFHSDRYGQIHAISVLESTPFDEMPCYFFTYLWHFCSAVLCPRLYRCIDDQSTSFFWLSSVHCSQQCTIKWEPFNAICYNLAAIMLQKSANKRHTNRRQIWIDKWLTKSGAISPCE